MYYAHLSAHSLLAKLGRSLMRMGLDWDCGESAGASRLKAPSGGVKYPGQVAPTTGSLIVVPPRPKEEVFKVVEPKLVERILLPFSNGTQGGGGDPPFPVHPCVTYVCTLAGVVLYMYGHQSIFILYMYGYWFE